MNPPKPGPSRAPKTILVVDVGGSHIKLMRSGSNERIKFESGPHCTPRKMMACIRKLAPDWEYDAVTIGLPMPIVHNRPLREPHNLGRGWVKFDFPAAFGKPCRLVNDAAMQALGSYEGGRMLFLGLGTGLGSAMVFDNVVISLELSELSYTQQRSFENMVGRDGRKRLGQKKWEAALEQIVIILKYAFLTDYIVIGGGNARHLEKLPKGARLGDNRNAFLGGLRLWGSGKPVGKTREFIIR